MVEVSPGKNQTLDCYCDGHVKQPVCLQKESFLHYHVLSAMTLEHPLGLKA